MSHPMRVDPVEIERMWRRGDLLRDIAAAFGVTQPAISAWARRIGLDRRPRGRRPGKTKDRNA